MRFINGNTANGTVSYVGLSADKATRTYRVEARMANPDAAIPDGVTCEMMVTLEPVEAAAVPRSALVFSDDGKLGVRVADAKSQARFVPVSIVDDGRAAGLGDRHRPADAGDRRRPGLRQGRRHGRGGFGCRGGARQVGVARRMRRIVDYAIGHSRLTLAVLIFLILAGITAYVGIPKEASPDVQIPIIYVQLSQRGISPEDAERLLVKPMETQLKIGHQRQGDAGRRL